MWLCLCSGGLPFWGFQYNQHQLPDVRGQIWCELKSLSTWVFKSPRFQLCSVLITDSRIWDYDTRKSRVMIHANLRLWYKIIQGYDTCWFLNQQVLDWYVIGARRRPQTVTVSKYSLCCQIVLIHHLLIPAYPLPPYSPWIIEFQRLQTPDETCFNTVGSGSARVEFLFLNLA